MQIRRNIPEALVKLELCAEANREKGVSDNPEKPLKSLIDKLRQLESFDPAQALEEKLIQELRTDFNHLFLLPIDAQHTEQSIELATASHAALIALAEIKPVNDRDEATLDDIPAERRIVFSTGRQYDVQSLLAFHEQRPGAQLSDQDQLLEELLLGKALRTTSHQGEIHPLDIKHFKKTLRQMNIRLPIFKKTNIVAFAFSTVGTFLWGSLRNNSKKYLDQAVKLLGNRGLTLEMLSQNWARQNASNDFSQEHVSALQFLIVENDFDKLAALQEINLLNEHEVHALRTLFNLGVRGNQLREWDCYAITFSQKHAEALIYLMRDQQPPLTFTEAMLELDQLQTEEAASLHSMYPIGLRGHHFGFFDGTWNHHTHGNLFRMLVSTEAFSHQQAMQECAELSSVEAGILHQQYRAGLRRIDLRRNPIESPTHAELFTALVRDEQLNFQQALTECRGLSWGEASTLSKFYHLGLRKIHLLRDPSLGKFDYYYQNDTVELDGQTHRMIAFFEKFKQKHSCDIVTVMQETQELTSCEKFILFELYGKGLRRIHLIECFQRTNQHQEDKNTFDNLHADILGHLVNKKGYAADVACKMLQGKNSEQLLELGTNAHWAKYYKTRLIFLIVTLGVLNIGPRPLTAILALVLQLYTMKTSTPKTNALQAVDLSLPPRPGQDPSHAASRSAVSSSSSSYTTSSSTLYRRTAEEAENNGTASNNKVVVTEKKLI